MDNEAQIELEQLFHKNLLLKRIRAEYTDPRIEALCAHHQLPYPFVVDFLTQLALHKRAKPEVLIGLLWRHFQDPEDKDAPPTQTALQACADMVARTACAGFAAYEEVGGRFVVVLDLNKETWQELARYQFPPPMVAKPKEVKHNNQTGYLSPECSKGSILLNGAYHEHDVCLDHINRLNSMELTINLRTAQMVKNCWKNLDKPKQDEPVEKYQKRVKAFEKYDADAHVVIEHLLVTGNAFHLTHRYDRRGRTYAQGYHVHTQGNSWNRAIIEFQNKEFVTGAKADGAFNTKTAA